MRGIVTRPAERERERDKTIDSTRNYLEVDPERRGVSVNHAKKTTDSEGHIRAS